MATAEDSGKGEPAPLIGFDSIFNYYAEHVGKEKKSANVRQLVRVEL